MKEIVLIACVSKKGKTRAKAKDLYKGALFTRSLAYAKSLKPDKIFIISALHGLLSLEKEIEPYDVTLSYVNPKKKANKPNLKVLSKNEAIKWGEELVNELKYHSNLEEDQFILLAGQSYVNPLKEYLAKKKEPLHGMRVGERIKELKRLIEKTNDNDSTQNI